MEIQERQNLKNKQRVVIKIGSSSLTHPQTEELSLMEIEKLIRVINDLRGERKDAALVSSGAIAANRQALDHHRGPNSLAERQVSVVVGQTRLMMVYQKLFTKYSQIAAQVLLTKDTMVNDSSRYGAQNALDELLNLGAIPTINESNTASASEVPYVSSLGDNNRPPAIVVALIGANLLIPLSDIDGLYSDDPRSNPDARFISLMPETTPEFLGMGKTTSGSDVETGDMSAKLTAAETATGSGVDMVVASRDRVEVILETIADRTKGTLFLAHPNLNFDLMYYLNNEYQGGDPCGYVKNRSYQ